MPKSSKKQSRRFTGKYDREGTPIYEGDLVFSNMEFIVVKWEEHRLPEGGTLTGYYVPDDCVVLGKVS